ncbi:MAG: hypothetical protein OEV99_05935 [Nitrospira sp.]|nr:hypothetical protein [Nitrospira sp.]MDH4369369.1 hypothetical protein [Nitrospira sp.]MDH5347271.1 hypothetical protein [Nitrospira sp.]MDH5498089.1 hypothetical protein [Nitrospira sp.]MDH5725258.1 hypothetical protein [Nitrospira sp.]
MNTLRTNTPLFDRHRIVRALPAAPWIHRGLLLVPLIIAAVCFSNTVICAGYENGELPEVARHDPAGSGHAISGLSFHVFVDQGMEGAAGMFLDQAQADAALQTVIDTFSYLNQHRQDYPRFDEAVSKGLLERVIVQPSVHNHEGKSFPFLVVRTVDPGLVRLLISVSSMKSNGYLGQAGRFAPVLAREFQWVVSKAETGHRPKTVSVERDFQHAPIRTDKDIRARSGEERVRLLQQLFETYLRTADDLRSLEGQSYYEVGSTVLVAPSQPDSTTKFYDLRVREALQKIVREPSFLEHLPLAVTNLLSGKIWNVAFVKIGQRDWATRTRVLPAEKAVLVGEPGRVIQPAAILINLHRTAAPDDPFYRDTKHLPMGALSTDQLALVIAKEIEHNIVEKSQSGHIAQDALSAPK